MTLRDWTAETIAKVDAYGLHQGVRSGLYDFWGGALRRGCHALGVDTGGTNIYEREWDVMVLLDTCRPDVLTEVAHKYPFIPESVPTLSSVGSTSWEWLHDTFDPVYTNEIANTAYVSANAHTNRFGDEFQVKTRAFHSFDEVWRYGWDDEFGGIPPRPVTDRAIATGRETDADRLVIHYMQPHTPYRSLDMAADTDVVAPGDADLSVWDLLQSGSITRESAWQAYRDNLEWVLEDVELLLSNLDAETVVLSSDHGEAFGEWGLYGHYRHVPVRALREVPWVKTSAIDKQTYEPALEPPENSNNVGDSDVKERLNALGYR